MRFLVTGATGFLGKYLVHQLINDQHEVIAVNRSGKKPDDAVWEKIQLIVYDGEYSSFIDTEPVDVVIHLATCFKSSHRPEEISELIDSNIKLGAHLLEWMQKKEIRRIVNISTYTTSIDGHSYSPQNFYAATKKMFEDLLTFYVQTYPMSAITLDMYDLYGPHDTRGKFIDLIFLAIKNDQVFRMSKGEQEISYVHVDDAVNAILQATMMFTDAIGLEEKFSVYSHGDIMTLLALVQKIEDVLGIHISKEISYYPYRTREMMKVTPSKPLLSGWGPKVSLEAGIWKKWKEYNEN